MSIEAVNQFLTKVREDKNLQAEVTTAMEAENDRQAVTELAAKHGYEFTSDELGSEIQKLQSEFLSQEESKLSEEDMANIAGGVLGFVSLGTAVAETQGHKVW